jgi:hypothetical protein
MGTWDTGIFDNDQALNTIDKLIQVRPKADLVHRLVDQGLQLWFGCTDGGRFMKALQRDTRELTKLPKPLFAALVELTANPTIGARDSPGREARSPKVEAVTGPYRDGWRIDAIFELPGALDVVRGVAERNAVALDKRLSPPAKDTDLFECVLTELGVLTVLTELNVRHAPDRVDAWERGFDQVNAATTAERPFWDEFAARVKPAFAMLRDV